MVIFGAGKIGRSFIGQLFSRGGYEVVFIDISRELITELNKRQGYQVIIKSEYGEQTMEVNHTRGIQASDMTAVEQEIATCSIIAFSVGQKGLPHVIPMLAKGLIKRQQDFPNSPLDIIIAENMRDADRYIREKLLEVLPSGFPLDTRVGLVETSIGKMVPIMPEKTTREDPLLVFAEPYNTLILDAKGFKNPIPDIEGLAPKQNMKAWVDRKLFIHNLGHAAAAYFGNYHLPEAIYMHEILGNKLVNELAKKAMHEAAVILKSLYPDEFSLEQLEKHVDDLIYRFQNKALGDTVFRVGRDLPRKLGKQDRLAYPIKAGTSMDLPTDHILLAYVCAVHFSAKNEKNQKHGHDLELLSEYHNHGINYITKKYGGFTPENEKKVLDKAEWIDKIMLL